MKKILLLIVALLLSLTLFACKEDTEEETVDYNANVPTGSLTDATYATLGNYTLTEKELYKYMRGNGYSTFVEELIQLLIPAATLEGNTDALKELVNESCYGTSDISEIDSKTKKTYVLEFVDNMALIGVTVDPENIYTDEVLTYFTQSLGYKNYAKSLLTSTDSKYYYGNETYTEKNDDGEDEEVTNTYYISEDDIESYYDSNIKEAGDSQGVIIAFHNLSEFYRVANLYGTYDSNTDSYEFTDAENNFKQMFKELYGYDASLTITTDDLEVLPETVQTIFDELEDGKYTVRYKEADDSFYLIYKKTAKTVVEYEDITAEKKAEVVDEIVDNKVTSTLITTAKTEALEAADVIIYDGLFDALYAEDYDHERLEASEWKDEYNANVAKVNDKYLTVESLNETFKDTLSIDATVLYFTNKVLIGYAKDTSYKYQLTDDDLEEINESYESALETFKNDENSSYPASIGVDNFNFLYYGATSEDEVLDLYKANKLFEYIQDDLPENIAEILEQVGKDYYETYYNLSIKHVLLMFDKDLDGEADDPEIAFADQYEDLKNTVDLIFKNVCNEVKYLVDTQEYCDLSTALDYICDQFNAGAKLESSDNYWYTMKKYNVTMKVEDLSSVSTSNGSSYVSEFSDAVQALYKTLSANDKADSDYIVDYDDYTSDCAIKTSYGFHLLTSYGTSDLTSAKYLETSDTSDQYNNFTAYYGADTNLDEDGKIIAIDSYSENAWASQNQIKLYLEYDLNDGSSSNIYSKAKTFIEYYYSSFMEKYQDEDFQTILFAKNELSDITYVEQANKDAFDNYFEILIRQYDSYADNSNNMYRNFWTITGVKDIQ